jgi:hypothetical protein
LTSRPDQGRRRIGREFRFVQAVFGTLFLATAYWLWTAERLGAWKWLLAPILALVDVSAVIDVFNGPFGKRER